MFLMLMQIYSLILPPNPLLLQCEPLAHSLPLLLVTASLCLPVPSPAAPPSSATQTFESLIQLELLKNVRSSSLTQSSSQPIPPTTMRPFLLPTPPKSLLDLQLPTKKSSKHLPRRIKKNRRRKDPVHSPDDNPHLTKADITNIIDDIFNTIFSNNISEPVTPNTSEESSTVSNHDKPYTANDETFTANEFVEPNSSNNSDEANTGNNPDQPVTANIHQ